MDKTELKKEKLLRIVDRLKAGERFIPCKKCSTGFFPRNEKQRICHTCAKKALMELLDEGAKEKPIEMLMVGNKNVQDIGVDAFVKPVN